MIRNVNRKARISIPIQAIILVQTSTVIEQPRKRWSVVFSNPKHNGHTRLLIHEMMFLLASSSLVWSLLRINLHANTWTLESTFVFQLIHGRLVDIIQLQNVIHTWMQPIKSNVIVFDSSISLCIVIFLKFWKQMGKTI